MMFSLFVHLLIEDHKHYARRIHDTGIHFLDIELLFVIPQKPKSQYIIEFWTYEVICEICLNIEYSHKTLHFGATKQQRV